MTRDELKAELASMTRDSLELLALVLLIKQDDFVEEQSRLRFELLRAKERVDVMLGRCPLESLQ